MTSTVRPRNWDDGRVCSGPRWALGHTDEFVFDVSEKPPDDLAEGKEGESNHQCDKVKDEQGPCDSGAGVCADRGDPEQHRCAATHAREYRPVLPGNEALQQTDRHNKALRSYEHRGQRFRESPPLGTEVTIRGSCDWPGGGRQWSSSANVAATPSP